METHEKARMAVARTRRPPGPLIEIAALHDRAPDLSIVPFGARVDYCIEATAPDGSLASWLDDEWWIDVLERWSDTGMSIQIAPTPDAILHPILLYQLEMVRRVACDWGVVGFAHWSEFNSEDAMKQAARSPYHEIRVIDADSVAAASGGAEFHIAVERILDSIRAEQSVLGVCQPRLVRLAPDALPRQLATLSSHA